MSVNWKTFKLGDVADWGSGGTPSRGKASYYSGKIPWIKSGELKSKYVTSTEEHISEIAIKESSAKLFPKNSVALAMYGANIGQTSILGIEAATNQAVAVAKPHANKITTEFLYYFLLSKTDEFKALGKGGAQPNISQGIIREMQISLPDVFTQKKIVSKIESFFSGIESGVIELERTKENIELYRQSVLNTAVRGKLVNQDPKDGSATKLLEKIRTEKEKLLSEGTIKKEKPLRPIDPNDVPFEIPKDWEWLRLGDLAALFRNAIKAGPFGSDLKKEFYVKSGYKIYGQEQVISGNPHLGDYYIDKKRFESLSANEVRPKDVLISLVGTVGRVLVLPEDIKPGIINPRLIKISVNQKLMIPEYLKIFLESPSFKSQTRHKTAGTTMDVMNLGILKSVYYPVPPLFEQVRICKAYGIINSSIESLIDELTTQLSKSSSLKKSILKSAFERRLNVDDDVVEASLKAGLAPEAKFEVSEFKKPIKKRESKQSKEDNLGLLNIIENFPDNKFTFDQLVEVFSSGYEQFKEELFRLLAEPQPIIQQEFDKTTKSMCFVKTKK